jgi:diadenosine tetraphosphate (Ap4A) HIT family hydrolase
MEANLGDAGPEEAIWIRNGWRVAHAFDTALPGWLVVLPRRHVESVDQLTDDEAAALGPVLRMVSGALVEVLGCAKTYVVMFAEAPGFPHLHFHVIPRAADMPEHLRGIGVFEHLRRPPAEWVTLDERRALATRLREATPSSW